jgi:hypothetical protein
MVVPVDVLHTMTNIGAINGTNWVERGERWVVDMQVQRGTKADEEGWGGWDRSSGKRGPARINR